MTLGPLKATSCSGKRRPRQDSLSSTASLLLLRAHTMCNPLKTLAQNSQSVCTASVAASPARLRARTRPGVTTSPSAAASCSDSSASSGARARGAAGGGGGGEGEDEGEAEAGHASPLGASQSEHLPVHGHVLMRWC